MSVAVKMIRSGRHGRRLEVGMAATLRDGDLNPVDVDIEDISVSGFRMLTALPFDLGERFTIGITGLGMQSAVIARQFAEGYGCEFTESVSQSYIDRLQEFGNPENIAQFSVGESLQDEQDDSAAGDQRYPAKVRVAMIVGSATICWVLVLLAAKSVL
ncbi:PilZ domain-containing protein [Sphingomonas sp. RB3P16]|uniref:PilZ domain-containing protein n=1 Tax=Parasphingomonas frigoris TaxID=3096163 RepID=UPI002FC7077C